MPDITLNPRRRAGRCWEGGLNLGGSLTLSKLQNANEMKGAFWVISFSLSEEALIYVMSQERGNKIRWCPSHVPHPRQAFHLHDGIGFPQHP